MTCEPTMLSPSDLHDDEDGRFDIQSKAYDPSFDVGDTLRFDLRANPVVSRRAAEGGKSRRHDMLMNAKKEARQNGA